MSSLTIMFVSFIGLFWAANHLVMGGSGLARSYRISPLIIGFTIVAIGTAMPGIFVGIAAALDGRNDLAFSNAVGSNIANIGLILGIIILVRPLTIRSFLLRQEYPLLLLVMLFTYLLMIDGFLGTIDGCLLLLTAIALIGYFIFISKKAKQDAFYKEFRQIIPHRKLKANIISIILGLIILPISAHFLVDNAIRLGAWLGLNDTIIGLTIVALGTSLPQMATSIIAIQKGQDDIAIGNILGSNMFNLLIVIGFPSIINPSAVNQAILWRDIPIMFVLTIILMWINFHYKKRTARWPGFLLLLIYCCYIISLIMNAVD
jgi:cation:H+ antiporter